MSFNDITEAPDTFIGKDGKTYKIRALKLSDWGKFIRWVQYKPYRDAVDASLSKEICDKFFEQCSTGKVIEETAEGVFEEFDITVGSTVVQKALETIEGVEKLVELSVPGIDLTLISLENYAEVHKKIINLNFPTSEGEDTKNP